MASTTVRKERDDSGSWRLTFGTEEKTSFGVMPVHGARCR